MIFKELQIVHLMLKEKISYFGYLHQYIKVLNPSSWKIFHMRNIDQEEWNRIKDTIDSTMSRKTRDKEEYVKIDIIQKLNTEKFKKIVNKKGCITISKFGIIASHCAWLIVQHSDHDKEFQKEYLRMMKENKKNVFLENIENLEKRLGI